MKNDQPVKPLGINAAILGVILMAGTVAWMFLIVVFSMSPRR